jgi:signal peptidase I
MRNLYRFLIRLHPARFREHFGEEMRIGFDAAQGRRVRARLLADIVGSLLLQWGLRTTIFTPSRRQRMWATVKGLASAVLFALVVTNHVAQATAVPTESMAPTIVPGDHMIVDKVGFPASIPALARPYVPQREIHRGDVVVFRWPVDPGVSYIKRVIGLPGDLVEIRDKTVYINGNALEEPYRETRDPNVYRDAAGVPEAFRKRDNYGPVTVPANQFFVLGDNRDNSLDSRYWGFLPRNDIEGEPVLVYWSYAGKARGTLSGLADLIRKTRWSRTGSVIR